MDGQAAPECKNSYRRACLGRLLAIKTRQPPYAVAWTGVDGGVISHLRIRNPPKAAMRIQYSHGVTIEHVVFVAKMPAPTDGLLIVSSHDVTVQRCRFVPRVSRLVFSFAPRCVHDGQSDRRAERRAARTGDGFQN